MQFDVLTFQVSDFFTRLIQRVAPKSYQQASGEVYVTRKFLENFAGDQVNYRNKHQLHLLCFQ